MCNACARVPRLAFRRRAERGRGYRARPVVPRQPLLEERRELLAEVLARAGVVAAVRPEGDGGGRQVAAEQFLAHARQHQPVDAPAVAEADLALGRVDVHVHVARRHLQQQDGGRVAARLGQAAVRLPQRVLDEAVADRPAVQVDVLVLGGRPRELGQADDAAQLQLGVAHVQRQALLVEFVGPRRQQPLLGAGGRRQVERRAAVVQQLEPDPRVGQGQPQHHLRDVPELGRRPLDELAPGGGVEEEVSDLDGRAGVAGGGLGVGDRPAAVVDLVRRVGAGRAGEDPRVGDRPDAGQGLAAEAHRADAEQVVVVAELAGRVRRERQRQVLRRDAVAVVDDADQRPPAVLHLDQDVGRAGVDRVLDQLLHDRRRPLDHLARGDAVDQGRGQLLDPAALHRADYRDSHRGVEAGRFARRSVGSFCAFRGRRSHRAHWK
jgi:hypothetical protein